MERRYLEKREMDERQDESSETLFREWDAEEAGSPTNCRARVLAVVNLRSDYKKYLATSYMKYRLNTCFLWMRNVEFKKERINFKLICVTHNISKFRLP